MENSIEVLAVDHQPVYVIGFPVHVAITVRARPDTSFNRLPFADLVDLHDCIGVQLTKTGSDRPQLQYTPTPVIEPEIGEYGDRLSSGESRRMLTDISPLIGTAIDEGEYEARITYVTTSAAYQAPPVSIRFRNPTGDETAMLASVAADRPQFPNWATWTVTRPHDPVDTGDITSDNPLKLNLLLRRFFFGPDPLERADPTALNALTELYKPEAQALKAELAYARGDLVTYQRHKAEALRSTPGLAWWFRMIEEGGGYLKAFRIN
jgi:hypothetical protein